MDVDEVLSRRFAIQHLTGPKASVLGYVTEALAVQSQDPPTARWSIGLRTGRSEAEICAELDAGRIVRTHVLRPTWHFVAASDLRWLQRLTGAKVERGMASRHRQLGLTDGVFDKALSILRRELAGRTHLTRRQLQPMLPATGAPHGQVTAHLLMVAEVRSVICSGPLRDGQHSYALVDEAIRPADEAFDEAHATRELVRRFFAGHGPAGVRDLARWCTLTLTQIREALGGLELESEEVDGVELWFDPATQPARLSRKASRGVHLLPTFDEAFLTYPRPGFPRGSRHPSGDRPVSFAEAGGGLVVVDLRDVGRWRRKWSGRTLAVTFVLDPTLGGDDLDRIIAEAGRMAEFVGARGLQLSGIGAS